MDHTAIVTALDRLHENLLVKKIALKHHIDSWIDGRFGQLEDRVVHLKTRLSGGQAESVCIVSGPPVETVRARSPAVILPPTEPSTSTSHKRDRSQSGTTSGINKRLKTGQQQPNASGIKRKNACKFDGCCKSFDCNADLIRHERIHLNIRPFSCTWPSCLTTTIIYFWRY